ncbi:MAG TPA: glycosidase, partial [Acidobacteriota bacterium]|nr:glycosidase [Acidobacteriota bacterium]
PKNVLLRLDSFILEPKLPYENIGVRPGAVFSCGSTIVDDKLFVYYGAGDSCLCVAQIEFSFLRQKLKEAM